MLIKYVSFIVSALITVSRASSIDSGEQKTATFPQDEEALIKKAPYAAEISSELSSTPFNDSKKAYLWNPQQFHGDVLEALQALSIVENLDFPPSYLKMIEFIADDSPLSRNYRDYITLNYSKPPLIRPQLHPIFWRSLILSSFTEFSSISPEETHQIIEKLNLYPYLDEVQVQSLFGYGLLDDQFLPKDHFLFISGWGHTPTVKVLLHNRDDISTDDVGAALHYAAWAGHAVIVELLLQNRTDFHTDDICKAFRCAYLRGCDVIFKLLLYRIDIPANHFILALIFASKFGYTSIVKLILEYRKDIDISSKYAGMALKYALKRRRTSIVELLLQSDRYIFADDVCIDYECDESDSVKSEDLKDSETPMLKEGRN